MTDGVRRFEDLFAWQRARELTRRIYLATREDAFRRDFGLASQVQRAAVSSMANIAEGFDRKHPAEFHQFLSIAKASCAEVRSHLYVALDVGYLDHATFDALKECAEEASRVIEGLRQAVGRRQGLNETPPQEPEVRARRPELRTQNSELNPRTSDL